MAAYVSGAAPALNPRNGMADSASLDPGEVAKFSAIAAEWWDPTGKFAPLHKFNPVRLSFIRAEAGAHFTKNRQIDARSLRPFEGLTLLDIGCGGGPPAPPPTPPGFCGHRAGAPQKNNGTGRAPSARAGLAHP